MGFVHFGNFWSFLVMLRFEPKTSCMLDMYFITEPVIDSRFSVVLFVLFVGFLFSKAGSYHARQVPYQVLQLGPGFYGLIDSTCFLPLNQTNYIFSKILCTIYKYRQFET